MLLSEITQLSESDLLAYALSAQAVEHEGPEKYQEYIGFLRTKFGKAVAAEIDRMVKAFRADPKPHIPADAT